jgi:hypothetical protein
MEHMIAEAGNTLVPAVLALEAVGYRVSQEGGQFIATSARGRYVASDPVCLLGLVKLVEVRGWAWHATGVEIDTTLERFGLGGNPPSAETT